MFTDLKVAADRRPMTTGERWFTALAGIAFTGIMLVDVLDEFTPAKLSIVFIFLFWIPLLVLHECGHALVARAVGWRVREMVIGFGPTIWRGTWGETIVKLRLAPMEGYVLPEPRGEQHIKFKSLLVYAAGPGAELALLALLIIVLGWDSVFNDSQQIGPIALKSLAIAILIGAITNLIPFRIGHGVSDGLGILMSPFMTAETIQLRLVSAERERIEQLIVAGDGVAAVEETKILLEKYDNNTLSALYARALSAAGRTEDARAWIRDKLSASGERNALLWLIAQAEAELDADSPNFLVLDSALQRARKLAPKQTAIIAMQGASHILKHQTEAGGVLLKEAWRLNDGSIDDAFILLYLTVAAKRLSEPKAAAEFESAFRLTNKRAQLAERLETLR